MIGIFDSGIGGLTVVKKIFEILPGYQIIYFGDTARYPYGGRSPQTIQKYSLEVVDFLVKKGAKVVIIACNTVSATAYQIIVEKFTLPVFEVVTPAVKKAVEITQNKRVGVIGTRATINSMIYEKLLKERDPKIQVFSRPAPLLVPLIEEGWRKKPETKRILKKYLHPLRTQKIDTLILACTHYPIIRDLIQIKIGRKVKIIDPGEEVAVDFKNYLAQHSEIEKNLIRSSHHKFYVSDLTPQFIQLSFQWLGKKIPLEEIKW